MKIQQLIHSKEFNSNSEKSLVCDAITESLTTGGYTIVELNTDKPWGAYFRIDSSQAKRFIEEFFSGLSIEQAQLGIEGAELSPKILLVSPKQRLSWQYHDRRAERWRFLTQGAYNKNMSDEPGEAIVAQPGDIVQFVRGERHRLIGQSESYTVVAEIWQHTDKTHPSDESDIVRLVDDYQR